MRKHPRKGEGKKKKKNVAKQILEGRANGEREEDRKQSRKGRKELDKVRMSLLFVVHIIYLIL